MVVDDDEGIREAIADLLQLDGFAVLKARDGRDALGVLDGAARPCVAVVDLVMPGLDGWALLRAIAASPSLRDIPIICCTAGRDDAPAGCAALLRKPFDADELGGAVRRAFDAAAR